MQIELCHGFTFCGLKSKHSEYVNETNQVGSAIKKLKRKIQNLENQVRSIDEFQRQIQHNFIQNLKPRLMAASSSYQHNKALLMRHLRLLRQYCDGTIPRIMVNDSEQLMNLLDKCTKKFKSKLGNDEYRELVESGNEIYSSGTMEKQPAISEK